MSFCKYLITRFLCAVYHEHEDTLRMNDDARCCSSFDFINSVDSSGSCVDLVWRLMGLTRYKCVDVSGEGMIRQEQDGQKEGRE